MRIAVYNSQDGHIRSPIHAALNFLPHRRHVRFAGTCLVKPSLTRSSGGGWARWLAMIFCRSGLGKSGLSRASCLDHPPASTRPHPQSPGTQWQIVNFRVVPLPIAGVELVAGGLHAVAGSAEEGEAAHFGAEEGLGHRTRRAPNAASLKVSPSKKRRSFLRIVYGSCMLTGVRPRLTVCPGPMRSALHRRPCLSSPLGLGPQGGLIRLRAGGAIMPAWGGGRRHTSPPRLGAIIRGACCVIRAACTALA